MAVERIEEMKNEHKKFFREYFDAGINLILDIKDIYETDIRSLSMNELEAINEKMYKELEKDNYETCFANPDYAKEKLGDYYKELCYIYTKLRAQIRNAYKKNLEEITMYMELFNSIYGRFRDELPKPKHINEVIYDFEKDNSEIFAEKRIRELVDNENTFAIDLVNMCGGGDYRYLYYYGEHISKNEIKMAEFLDKLPEEEIKKLAHVYASGYIRGFKLTGKDLSIKESVDIRYNIGFERIVKASFEEFKKEGLKPVIYTGGYSSTSINRQFDYDHKNDEGLFIDKAYIKRKLEVTKTAFENVKEKALLMAGPAVIEIFGETPFEPVSKSSAISLDEEQQKIQSEYRTKYVNMVNQYIKGDERSFTIIAFPIPEFGDNFEEMFRETVKINTLDQVAYGKVQKKIIDTLDKGEYVVVKGMNGNETDIKVMLHELKNPEKETNFENCLADVNIPLGEVFTSPKLTGTNGILNVSNVYLNGLNFKNLKITFEDGKIKDYTCDNFEDEKENKKYIKQNVMFNHDTLPIGEFAIGTNTTAYVIANKYDVVYKLPILIVEKMGPHFAVGDTCYSFEEDIKTYNPDGKEIVARDNEITLNRKTDISKAYFGCHTDITIPYDELKEIYVVDKNNEKYHIISQGRFVLEGCELLNEPFDE